MRAISLDNEDDFMTYQNCDFKLFIKMMKEILKRKIYLNYEIFGGKPDIEGDYEYAIRCLRMNGIKVRKRD